MFFQLDKSILNERLMMIRHELAGDLKRPLEDNLFVVVEWSKRGVSKTEIKDKNRNTTNFTHRGG